MALIISPKVRAKLAAKVPPVTQSTHPTHRLIGSLQKRISADS
jgi:hypothetical protein